MLKSKNQVTLFVNYSYNSLYDLKRTEGYVPKYGHYGIFYILYGELYMNVPLTLLTTVGYLLEVFIRLWIPSMVRIFTSAWS